MSFGYTSFDAVTVSVKEYFITFWHCLMF